MKLNQVLMGMTKFGVLLALFLVMFEYLNKKNQAMKTHPEGYKLSQRKLPEIAEVKVDVLDHKTGKLKYNGWGHGIENKFNINY